MMQTRTIPVRNPLTGEYDYSIEPPSDATVHESFTRLRTAQEGWAALRLEERISIMQQWAAEIEARATGLMEADAADTGWSSISTASPFIVLEMIRDWCRIAPDMLDTLLLDGDSRLHPTMRYRTQLVPYGVVAVISPWNAPLMQSMMDAIPALIAGCAVMVKPSEVAPRFIEPLRASILRVPGLRDVCEIVAGDAAVGSAMVREADVVCFTGSVATGKKIAVAAAERLIPVYLELGGNDPAIVTETADLDRAAAAIVSGAVSGTGQVCFSVERVYVHESVAGELVSRISAAARRVTLNTPENPREGDIGPFGFAAQAGIVAEHLRDALEKGARIVEGGFPFVNGGADYMRPTVLVGVNDSMRILREETFGPVVPVAVYRTIDEAVALANSTEYGLSASVFAGTIEEAEAIAERLEAGTVSVQDTCLTTFKGRDIGNDSYGSSGLGGDRTGPRTILRYVRKKSILTNHGVPLSLGGRPRGAIPR